uniref:DUF3951 domain-containing protein n=2 Tax=Strongyloides TaxID=6247 RepID=A0A0K0FIB5_STRVS
MIFSGLNLYIIIFGTFFLLLLAIAFIYGYFKIRQMKKEKETEKARYISLYSRRENGDEVLGKHYVPSQQLSVPKTDKDIQEEYNTNTNQ